MPKLQPISQKQVKIECSALQGIFWTSQKGGELSHEEVTYTDPSIGLEQTLAGMAKISKLTLSKPYDPVNDVQIQRFIAAQQANRTPFSVVVAPVNSDVAGTPLAGAKAITYANCTFTGYTPPTFDRDGSGIAKCEMMLAVNSMPSYGSV